MRRCNFTCKQTEKYNPDALPPTHILCSGYLFLQSKLLHKLVHVHNNYLIISHDFVGQDLGRTWLGDASPPHVMTQGT